MLIDLDHANDEITAELLSSVARGNAAVALDDFDVLSDEVEARRADLEERQGQADAAQQRYAELKAAAEAEVVHLAEVEKQRLVDEAVQAELDRQREAREAAIAAEAAADARKVAAARRDRVEHGCVEQCVLRLGWRSGRAGPCTTGRCATGA